LHLLAEENRRAARAGARHAAGGSRRSAAQILDRGFKQRPGHALRSSRRETTDRTVRCCATRHRVIPPKTDPASSGKSCTRGWSRRLRPRILPVGQARSVLRSRAQALRASTIVRELVDDLEAAAPMTAPISQISTSRPQTVVLVRRRRTRVLEADVAAERPQARRKRPTTAARVGSTTAARSVRASSTGPCRQGEEPSCPPPRRLPPPFALDDFPAGVGPESSLTAWVRA